MDRSFTKAVYLKDFFTEKSLPVTVRAMMPVSTFGYVTRLKKFMPACRNALRRPGTYPLNPKRNELRNLNRYIFLYEDVEPIMKDY
jgi:hypothetical protein